MSTRPYHMIYIKDNIYLAPADFLLNESNLPKLKENSIKKIVLCTEYIDLILMKNQKLAEFILYHDISFEPIFDTNRLILEANHLKKGTIDHKNLRNEIRYSILRDGKILRVISEYKDGNILLVCNKINKMSPVICLLIEKFRNGKLSDSIVDSIVDSTQPCRRSDRIEIIMNVYNNLTACGNSTTI